MWLGAGEGGEEFVAGGFDGVGADAERGGGVVPLGECAGGVCTESGGPFFQKELRVAPLDAEWRGGECGEECGAFAVGAAEDGVDEAAGATGEGDGFFHRCPDGDAGVENLVEPEAEDGAGVVVEIGVAEPGDEEVEFAEAAEDAVEKFGDEAAVAGVELRGVEALMEEIVGVGAFAFPCEEELVDE